eukprot:COSAG04_NODE_6617_length_1291_cov_1.928691_2_plen_92_part_01
MLLRALAIALLPGALAGRLTVGAVGSLFSEGILTWDDVLGLDSSATLHVSGKLGTSCGDDVRSQALCALQSAGPRRSCCASTPRAPSTSPPT